MRDDLGIDDYEQPEYDWAQFQPKSEPESQFQPFKAWSEVDEATIPAIRFVYGAHFAAGYVTQSIAAPKVGKSLLTMAECIDAATGRGFLTGRDGEPQRVLFYCAEDDQAVMDARTIACLRAYGIPQSEIAGQFFPVSGMTEGRELVLLRGEKIELQEDAFRFLADQIKAHGITLVIFDPLQDLSESPETNEAFRALGKRLRKLATETGAAIGIVHHTRKPAPGVVQTMDDGRGGSALRGVARFNRLLVPMTETEGAQAGVEDFRNYFRIAEAESNLAPPSSERNKWFEKIGVQIGNGRTYPTIRPWTWPEAFAGITVDHACRVRNALADLAANDTPARENIQAANWAGKVVAELLGLDPAKKSDNARIKALLKKWTETGVLVVEKIKNDKGKEIPHIFPGPNNPGVCE